MTTPGYRWDRCPQDTANRSAPEPAPRLVVIESPFAPNANKGYTLEDHASYLDRCMLDAFQRNEAPYAGHRLYTGILDDTSPEQRAQGMRAGLAWMRAANLVAVYTDYGISGGMEWGISNAEIIGVPVVFRVIGQNRACVVTH